MIQNIGIERIQGFTPGTKSAGPKVSSESFSAILDKVSQGITVSAHARQRIASRSIPFGPEEQARMETAVEKANAKGCRESLVLMDSTAFVVNIRNRTVVTAMDGMNVKDNVFTNIDSAVIA